MTGAGTQPPASAVAQAIGGVLRHPWTMALKAAIREAVWTFRRHGVVNPPLPATVDSILFVCLGNICRSPFAEHLAARRAAGRGRPMRVASAGISAKQSGAVPSNGRDVARTYAVDLDRHRPQRLTRELMDDFDLVVVMEAAQLEALRAKFPDAADRIVLLPLFDPAVVSAHARCHIADPFSQPRTAFEASFARIDRAVGALLDRLPPAGGAGARMAATPNDAAV